MPRVFKCDLHVHTCLSPCADLDMYPRAIVKQAIAAGLDMIAICDHNASENAAYVQLAAAGKPLTVLFGMEITSCEEVHLLAIFENQYNLNRIQDIVYECLPGLNNEEIFGVQAIVNDFDDVEGLNERLLIGATLLPLTELIAHIHANDGLAIASHIDRESFSVISQLGFIDQETAFDALEISSALGIIGGRQAYPDLAKYPFVTSSDAHFIQDLGKVWMNVSMEEATFHELKMALAKRFGRHIQE